MAPTNIKLGAIGKPLTPCTPSPQLLPFHIAYSGPAPVTTFFRVRELEEEIPKHMQAGNPSSSCLPEGTPPFESEKSELDNKENGACETKRKPRVGLGRRLVAAFRGRRMVGTEVPLPEGYVGLVLLSDEPGKTGSSSNPSASNGKQRKDTKKGTGRKATTRATRRSKAAVIDVDTEEPKVEESIDAGVDDLTDSNLLKNSDMNESNTKTLKPTQTFSSFIVWNADIPVDEGRDEYVRALREWTGLAAEIHQSEK